MKLTIQSIIRWEQLCNKPFSQLNYSNEEDILSIFYTCSLDQDHDKSYEEFKNDADEQEILVMMKSFEKYSKIMAQFQHKNPQIKKKKIKQEESEKESEPIFIKQLVSLLIMNGLDANYALNEMSLSDLPVYLEAYDTIRRERLEQERLWTYINISPYLSSKTSSPKELFTFPWEVEDTEEENAEIAEKGIAIFEGFMEQGRDFIE